MTRKKKLSHLYTYYRKPFLVIVFALILGVGFLSTVFHSKTTTEVFYCAIINNNLDRNEASYLTEGFSPICQPAKKEYLTFDFGNPISYESTTALESFGTLQKLFAKSQAKELDCIISSPQFLEKYGSGILTDLKEFLPSAVLSQVQEQLVYAPNEDGIPTPYGIDISQSHIVNGAGIYITQPILSVGLGTKHKKNVIAFLKYVMAIQ